MKGDHELLALITFFFFGCMVGSMLSADKVPEWVVSLLGAFATLAATFLGAFFAFRFQSLREKQKEADAERTHLNKAILELTFLFNKFKAIQNQFIDPQRKNPLRHMEMLPVATSIPPPNLEVKSLTFLLEKSDPNILGTLSRLELDATSTIEIIAQRSDLHFNRFQPAIQRAQRIHGPVLSMNQIVEELGHRDAAGLQHLTDAMIEGIDRTIDDCKFHMELLTRLGQAEFPKKTIIHAIDKTTRDPKSQDENPSHSTQTG